MAAVDLAKQVGTTKGDLYVYNGSTLVRLPVGADDTVLKADSGAAAGVSWGVGGGGSAQELGSMFAGIDSRTAFANEFGADEGYDEEFDGSGIADNTLPSGGSGTWSWLNQDTAVWRQSFGQGRVDWGGGGDTSNLHIVHQTFPGSDAAWTADAHLFGATAGDTSTYIAALTLYSSVSGRIVAFAAYNNETEGDIDWYVNLYTDADTYSSTLSGAAYPIQPDGSHRWFPRIVKNSQTDYDFLVSPEGGCYFTVGNAINVYSALNSQEPTHIGVAYNSSEAGHAGLEWIRLRGVT